MNPRTISIDMAVQYFQTLPLRGIAYFFVSDRLGVDIALSMSVHRGLKVVGIVVPEGVVALGPHEFPVISPSDLAGTPFDFILVSHPKDEQEHLRLLTQVGVPAEKVIGAYSDGAFSNWVTARETYARHRSVDFEFEDLLAYRSEGPFLEIAARCTPYTVTSLERMFSLYKAVEYVVKNRIEGPFVECGVWNGGSTMLAALTFLAFGDKRREIYLFDTFAGMTEPDEKDSDLYGTHSMGQWEADRREDHNEWCYGSLETVQTNMKLTGYPEELIHYVQGDVATTLPDQAPDRISVLRLDTDWYSSTLHELECLFPKVVRNGVLIIDDYGHWEGARKAVDDYFAGQGQPVLLNRIDYTGRLVLKTF